MLFFPEISAVTGRSPEFDHILFPETLQVTFQRTNRNGESRRNGIGPQSRIPPDEFRDIFRRYSAIYSAIYSAREKLMLLECLKQFLKHEVDEDSGVTRFGTGIDRLVIALLIVMNHAFDREMLENGIQPGENQRLPESARSLRK